MCYQMTDVIIQQFTSEQFGNLRVISDNNGDPWFVAKDVCDALGLEQVTRAISNLDEDEVTTSKVTDSMGRNQNANIISEAGLYSMILRSRKPEAKEFKRWITHTVIPSIRKHGGYVVGQERFIEGQMTPEEMALRSMQWLTSVVEEQKRHITDLTNENEDLAAKNDMLVEDNAKMLPKAMVYDSIMSADGTTTVMDTSRYMNQMGAKMTAHRLYGLLRLDGWVCKSSRAPTKKAIDAGFGKQMMTVRVDGKANEPYVRLTQKGVEWCLTHYANVRVAS